MSPYRPCARPLRALSAAIAVAVAVALLLVPARAAQAATPGLNVAGVSERELAPALATGTKLIRLFVSWEKLEPEAAGQYPDYKAHPNPGALNNTGEFDRAIRLINAAGAKPMFVVVGAPKWANGSDDHLVPPSDPATFAAFFGRFVGHTSAVGDVAAYEVWNEEDAPEFWHGKVGAEQYLPMLKASYAAAKKAAPGAVVLMGPTTGNNAPFVSDLYRLGAKGSFDGIAVHTDTACLSFAPDRILRDGPGKPLNQYTFLGYRSVREVQLANGDPGPKIWMTEAGWSSSTAMCARGAGAGAGPGGVGPADQARHLTQAFGCMAHDDYVEAAAWFTFYDADRYLLDEINRYGLVDLLGAPKPALLAFKAVVDGGGRAVTPCGDLTAPAINVLTPVDGDAFTQSIQVQASALDASDPGVAAAGVKQINFAVDGGAPFYRMPVGDGQVASKVWYGAKDLADGPHTITAQAFDHNGNATTRSVTVCKGAACAAAASYPTSIGLRGSKPRCRGRSCTVTGALVIPAGKSLPSGRIRVEWQSKAKTILRRAGKKRIGYVWTTFHKGGSSASKSLAFRFTQKLKRAGAWRVRVYYEGVLPARPSTSPFRSFRV